MGLLNDLMSDDANNVFADTDGHAECFQYVDARGRRRTANGIVDRDPPAPVGDTGASAPLLVIRVPFCEVESFDNGIDRVVIAIREGEKPTERQVAQVVDERGMWRIEVR